MQQHLPQRLLWHGRQADVLSASQRRAGACVMSPAYRPGSARAGDQALEPLQLMTCRQGTVTAIDPAEAPRCFRRTGGALLRATPYVQTDVGCPGVKAETTGSAAHWAAWLREVWAHPEIAAAVEVASLVLAGRVEELVSGKEVDARRLRRMVLSMVRYLARMTGRATPFGLFAGVAAVRFDDKATVSWGSRHRAIVDADAAWVTAVISRLESYPAVVHRIPVVASDTCFVRGDRLVLPYQGHLHRGGRLAAAEVSVRFTPGVEMILGAARTPVVCGELVSRLAMAYPGTSPEIIESMLVDLVGQGVLISGLRAPTTVPDALGYLLEQLAAINVQDIPQAAPLATRLREIHDALRAHNRFGTPQGIGALRRSIQEPMASLADDNQRLLKIDLGLDCEVTVPESVAREAEAAASMMIRLTPYPFGTPAWREYHDDFVERYGIGALVPVKELVDPGSGLGLPAGYKGSDRTERHRTLSRHDTRLLAKAQRATADRAREVVLDEPDVDELAGESLASMRVPAHVEVCVEIHASDVEALTEGDFTLTVTAAPRAAGTTTGRFAGVLNPTGQESVTAALAGLPAGDPTAEVVQVSFPPLAARSGNVVRTPAFLPQTIYLGEHHPNDDGAISLDDLAVSSDGTHLFLLTISTQRRVEPTVFHALEFRHNAPPLGRFLCEVARATSAVYGLFDWGAAEVLPFLPRVRYRRTVLSPARWTLPARDLAAPGAPWPEWTKALAEWRRRYLMPSTVHLWEADRRLELDLDEDAHCVVLRLHLDDVGEAMLTEAPAAQARGWLDGRAAELVLPLTSTQAVDPQPARRWAPDQVTDHDHGHLPGGPPWLYARVYTPAHLHAIILRDHMPFLLAAWDTPPQWWFVRYRDRRGSHLRLRIRVADVPEYAQAADRVRTWVADLRRLRLAGEAVFDTYYPETGRYGTGAAMTAVESVFAADSCAVVDELTASRHDVDMAQALSAVSLIDTAAAFLGDQERGTRWLVEHPIQPGASPRAAAALAVRLAADPDAVRPEVSTAWRARAQALAAYRAQLAATAVISSDSVLPDLLHMHHNRAAGVDADGERVCLRLARAAALSLIRRTDKTGAR